MPAKAPSASPQNAAKTSEDAPRILSFAHGYRKVFAYIFAHLVMILLIYTGRLDVRNETISLAIIDCLKWWFVALAGGSIGEHVGKGIGAIVGRVRGG